MAVKVYDALVENFPQTYLVGGTVRNLILARPIADIDIATEAKPEKVLLLLKKLGCKIDLKGIRFGVISVLIKNKAVEIATFRKEAYSGSRFPKIIFTKSINLDAKRRDFTINCLYFHPKTNKLYDPYNGAKDIKNRVIKLIGNAEQRLEEDPLRIVRAYRFENELDLHFDSATLTAIRNKLHLVNDITVSKLKSEIAKSKTAATRKYLTKIFKKLLHK